MRVLGNANLYPECKNHSRLENSWRRFDFNMIESKNDGNLSLSWYRIFSEAGKRLMDINDIKRDGFLNRSLVSLILMSNYMGKLALLLYNFPIL